MLTVVGEDSEGIGGKALWCGGIACGAYGVYA